MRKRVKALIVGSFVFSAVIVGLAVTPHYTCGCPQYEDGSQLTNIINNVSKKVIGRPIIKKNPNPY